MTAPPTPREDAVERDGSGRPVVCDCGPNGHKTRCATMRAISGEPSAPPPEPSDEMVNRISAAISREIAHQLIEPLDADGARHFDTEKMAREVLCLASPPEPSELERLREENVKLRDAVSAALCTDSEWWITCENALAAPPTQEPTP